MQNQEKNFNLKNFLIQTICFVPVILLGAEGICYLSLRVKNVLDPSGLDVQNNVVMTPDPITGTYRYEVSKENIENKKNYINRHNLIKTSFISNKLLSNEIKGILVTGNSVALGYPMTNEGQYLNSFVNKLEQSLRLKDEKIDVINLSFYGFNSWQENIQLARYFNSEENHNDLPSNIVLTASIGGIQDFWQFIDLINMKPKEKDIYHNANGLMTTESGILLGKFNKAMNGNIMEALELFLRGVRRNSNIYKVFKNFTLKNSRFENSTFEDANIKIEKTELKEIINKKVKISLSEYEKRKQIVVDSVARNLKSMSALNDNKKIIFIYLPTRFSSFDKQVILENRYVYNNKLNISDLNRLEKDYRETLIKNLSSINNLTVFNLALNSEYDWFVDESHFSEKGHKIIANKLIPIFQEVLD